MTRKDQIVQEIESMIEVRYATSNPCYKGGRTISKHAGCVNHSIGCAQPSCDVMFNVMNKSDKGWAVNAIIGDFHKGPGRIILCMPLKARPWGCGSGKKGSWNNTKIQWEICEPAGHTYAGGTMINYDVKKNQAYFDRMWTLIVKWNVYCAVKLGYDASGISDHAESYKAGYGSNHGDIGQWWPKHGKTMDDLRKEVAAILNDKIDVEDDEMTQEKFNEMLAVGMKQINPTYPDIKDVPSYWQTGIKALMDAGYINGGTPAEVNDNDLHLTRDVVKSLVILKSYIDDALKKANTAQ